MKSTVKEIAALVKGQVRGDADRIITGAAGLIEASNEDISFLKDTKPPKLLDSLKQSKAGAVLVPSGLSTNGRTVIEVQNPLAAFAAVLDQIQKEQSLQEPGIHPLAHVAKSATIGEGVAIGPFCVIEEGATVGKGTQLTSHIHIGRNSHVGENTLIYPHVVIRERCRIGNQCIIQANATIGSDGYGYYFADSKHNKIPQIGNVIIEDQVEVGSCTTIDRATTGSTIIRKGTKIDNLVQVAHNVEIGENSLLVAQVGIAGSTRIGHDVVLAGQAGVADHLTIGDGAQIGGQSAVKKNVDPGAVLYGSPAQPLQDNLKQFSLIKKLPTLFREFKKLKDTISRYGKP